MSNKFRFYLYDHRGKSFTDVRNGTVAGRSDSEIVFPDDDLLSRRHCQFFVAGNELYIEDMGSTNKTRVNSVPLVPNKRRRVLINDVIEFGSQRLIVTHQKDHVPANIREKSVSGRIYKARRRGDGRLTGWISDVITKGTLVRISRPAFRKLRLRSRFRILARGRSAMAVIALATMAAIAYLNWHS